MMLSDYVSSFIPHPPSGTHQSLRFRKTHQYMKTFNLTSIMTEGQKYYFKQIRFLSRSVTTPRLPCLGRFPFLSTPLLFQPECLPSIDQKDVNNSTYT